LGEILVQFDIVTENDIMRALEYGKKNRARLGESLIALGVIDQETLNWAIANHFNIPYLSISMDMLDFGLIRGYSVEMLLKHKILPLVATEDEISFALADPTNLEGLEEITRSEQRTINISIAPIESIVNILYKIFDIPKTSPVQPAPKERSSEDEVITIQAEVDTKSNFQTLNDLIFHAVAQNFQQIFLEKEGNTFLLSARFNNQRILLETLEKENYKRLLKDIFSKLEVTTQKGIIEKRFEHLNVRENFFDINVSMFMDQDKNFFTFEINPSLGDTSEPLECYKLSESQQSELLNLLDQNRGLILISADSSYPRHRFLHNFFGKLSSRSKLPGRIISVGPGPWKKEWQEMSPFQGLSAKYSSRELLQKSMIMHPDVLVCDPVDLIQTDLLDDLFRLANSQLVIAGLDFSGTPQVWSFLKDHGYNQTLLQTQLLGIISIFTVALLCDACKTPVENVTQPGQYQAKGCEKCYFCGYSHQETVIEFMPVARFGKNLKPAESLDDAIREYQAELKFFSRTEQIRRYFENGQISIRDFERLV
jgi:type II secretory ATPase GspE/PulE/Tfp pilus assembly ATPase PilB-like protein